MTLNHDHMGHAHFWERAMTRRNFIGAAAVAGGAAATAGMWLPQFAKAAAVTSPLSTTSWARLEWQRSTEMEREPTPPLVSRRTISGPPTFAS
ncbi:MAG: twin-arginine translocation signal domain-containing protein [Chloroflexi bacterium]|nr:MAG: twin-arginine translocation signal domain-containing protein [Chloroflexota bacterium]